MALTNNAKSGEHKIETRRRWPIRPCSIANLNVTSSAILRSEFGGNVGEGRTKVSNGRGNSGTGAGIQLDLCYTLCTHRPGLPLLISEEHWYNTS
jgi:hypothetical protein